MSCLVSSKTPVCQAELRTTGSEMRGVAGRRYAPMGLQKVAGTWPEVQQKR